MLGVQKPKTDLFLYCEYIDLNVNNHVLRQKKTGPTKKSVAKAVLNVHVQRERGERTDHFRGEVFRLSDRGKRSIRD